MSIDLRSLALVFGSVAPLLLAFLFDDTIVALAGPGVWFGLLLLAVVCFFVLTHHYIRRLDEAAWQAQKHAWYWGGSVGMGIGLAASAPMAGLFLRLLPTPVAEVTSGQAFFAGAVYLMVCQMAGFTVGWIIWWARRT